MLYTSPAWWNALSLAWKAITGNVAGIPAIAAAWSPIAKAKNWLIARYDGLFWSFFVDVRTQLVQ